MPGVAVEDITADGDPRHFRN